MIPVFQTEGRPGNCYQAAIASALELPLDGYGNAVSPAVGMWIGLRLRAALHGEPVAV